MKYFNCHTFAVTAFVKKSITKDISIPSQFFVEKSILYSKITLSQKVCFETNYRPYISVVLIMSQILTSLYCARCVRTNCVHTDNTHRDCTLKSVTETTVLQL